MSVQEEEHMRPDVLPIMSPSRRNFLKALGMTAAVGLINACTNGEATATTAGGGGGTGGTAAAGGGGAGNFPETPAWQFAFVNHVTTNPFFVPTVYGLQDAAAILGIPEPQWTGSEIAENAEMVNAMEAAIAAEVDGIGVCLVDLEAFNGPTDDALAAGIPVIAYNADTPPDNPNNRLCYVGQDLYGSGYEMGNRIVDLVGSGKVALFIATPGQLNIQPRIDGALDAIAESGADIEAIDIATGPSLEEELTNVEAWYLGNQDATGMFAVDAGSTQAVGQVVRDQSARDNGLVGAGGYDLLPETVQLVSDGVLDFTIDQQPYLQGFLPTVYLYLYKLSGGVVTPPETNTGLVFLDSDSATLFLETSSRFEGDAEEQAIIEPVG
jgi:simple sugar transport system substrate-binding protein